TFLDLIKTPPSYPSCIFSFYSYAHLRPLHSFPTRRSSDLADVQALPYVPLAARHQLGAGESLDERVAHRPALMFRNALERESQRSEEHTSELQSLAYLVCRLLLEKKKKK